MAIWLWQFGYGNSVMTGYDNLVMTGDENLVMMGCDNLVMTGYKWQFDNDNLVMK